MTKQVDLNQTEPAPKKTRKNDDVWRIAQVKEGDAYLRPLTGEYDGKESAKQAARKGNLEDGTYHLVRMSPPFTVKTETKPVTKIEF